MNRSIYEQALHLKMCVHDNLNDLFPVRSLNVTRFRTNCFNINECKGGLPNTFRDSVEKIILRKKVTKQKHKYLFGYVSLSRKRSLFQDNIAMHVGQIFE